MYDTYGFSIESASKLALEKGYQVDMDGFCGDPHVQNTGELVSFKIIKEQAASAGVRRIKAVIDVQ